MEQELPHAVIAALSRGQKIEAIKILRQEQGMELKDSKDAVEQYVIADPVLRHKLATAQAEGTRVLLRWLILIIVVGLAVAYVVWGR
jgi:ribosomal protein L7/L12